MVAYKVAPSPEGMEREAKVQPKNPDNHCCCGCFGKAPGPVKTAKIEADGGKWIQLDDGRIVEYFIYGSESPDARVLLQINGSMGTGWYCAHVKAAERMRELNIKGISVTIPGHAYSTAQGKGRRIADWAKDDVEPVLLAEGIKGPFMVEGSSFGSSHALAVALYFGERVEAMHLHVPYINFELRQELGMALKGKDEAFVDKDAAWVASCGSCPIHCCCCLMFGCCVPLCPGATEDEHSRKQEAAMPGSTKLQHYDIRRASHAGWNSYGLLHNAIEIISKGWGLDPRDVKTSKVMISYNDGDQQSPTEQGAWLAEHFSKTAAVCKVNHAPDEGKKKGENHGCQQIKLIDGTFVEMLAAL